jgi:CheY-like chemotaxis protein
LNSLTDRGSPWYTGDAGSASVDTDHETLKGACRNVELQGEGMSKTILLADDSPTIQKVVELTFVDTDFSVEAVSNGDELLSKLPEARPDIIVCDVIMPGTDGYDVCQQVKSDPDTLHIPVILLTGTFEPFDRDRAVAAGCSEIITKPFEARKLVEVVQRLAGGDAVAVPSESATPSHEFDSAVAPPTQPPPPSPAAMPSGFGGGEAEFGTMMAPPPVSESADDNMVTQAAGDDALDFTSSGFAEMEAAAAAGPPVPEVPSDGLDFDAGDTDAAFEAPSIGGETTQPIPSEAVEEAVAHQEPDPEPPIGTDDPFTAPVEPFGGVNGSDEPFAATDAESDPAEGGDLAPDEVQFGDAMEDEPTVTSASDVDRPVVPESDAALDGDPVADDTADMPEPPTSTPIPAPVEVTSAPMPAASPAPVESAFEAARLSEEDIDRIARRVLELASDTLERIAWDVVPDMAEIVVRERVREIEESAQVDGGA